MFQRVSSRTTSFIEAKKCTSGTPGVYVYVPNYVSWIKNTIARRGNGGGNTIRQNGRDNNLGKSTSSRIDRCGLRGLNRSCNLRNIGRSRIVLRVYCCDCAKDMQSYYRTFASSNTQMASTTSATPSAVNL